MANVRTPRVAWIEAALKALAAGGPDAVRVETLATGLGVTKGGFYWHFADRQALLDEMVDVWEEGTEDVIALLERKPTGARDKLRRLFDLMPSVDFGVELAMRDWARRDDTIAERLRRVDSRRMGYMSAQFREFAAGEDDADARSMLAYALMIGSYFVTGQPGDRSRPEVLSLAVERLVGEAWDRA